MKTQRKSYSDAFGVVSSARACVYPNVGFQLQLCALEKRPGFFFDGDDAASFDVARELARSIDQALDNAKEALDLVFDDTSTVRDDPSRWLDLGFFFQNCREYLGHVDVGLPLALLAKVDDLARKLKNLDAVFEGPGITTASRLGRLLDVWHNLQLRMAHAKGALPRLDMDTFVSALAPPTEAPTKAPDAPTPSSGGAAPDDQKTNEEPLAKRPRPSSS
mmetsp:Transcript_220/g.815  ORF Transcript_220/g.815 Transcript_220/m.815 type:complete len:219 (+) Transcript_220:502-1158(+)